MALTRPRFSQVDTGIARFSDPLTTVNDKATLANVDVGFVFNRDGGVSSNVAVIWDETNDQFALALTSDSGATNANVTISDYADVRVGSAFVDDVLRIAQNASGLRMTNVGAFDNDGSDNFRIFATNDLIIAANGESGTAITIDATNQNVAVSNDLTVSGDLDIDDADSVFVHGDVGYVNKRYVLYGTTTDATVTEIFVGGTTNSRVAVANNTTMFYTVDIVARRTDATGESAGWQLKGVADNFSGTTADVGDVYEVAVARDDANWEVDCLADNTDDAVVVTVTGAAGKTVKWMAVVKTMEIAN